MFYRAEITGVNSHQRSQKLLTHRGNKAVDWSAKSRKDIKHINNDLSMLCWIYGGGVYVWKNSDIVRKALANNALKVCPNNTHIMCGKRFVLKKMIDEIIYGIELLEYASDTDDLEESINSTCGVSSKGS